MAEEIEPTEINNSAPSDSDRKIALDLAQALEIEARLKILSARITSFVLPSIKGKQRYQKDVEEYSFEIFTRPQSSRDNKFRIILYIECKVVFKDGGILGTSAQAEVIFQIDGPNKLIDEAKQFMLKEQEPRIILAALSTAYSTVRGMFLVKAAGTLLEKAILPIIAPIKLLVLPPPEVDGE